MAFSETFHTAINRMGSFAFRLRSNNMIKTAWDFIPCRLLIPPDLLLDRMPSRYYCPPEIDLATFLTADPTWLLRPDQRPDQRPVFIERTAVSRLLTALDLYLDIFSWPYCLKLPAWEDIFLLPAFYIRSLCLICLPVSRLISQSFLPGSKYCKLETMNLADEACLPFHLDPLVERDARTTCAKEGRKGRSWKGETVTGERDEITIFARWKHSFQPDM